MPVNINEFEVVVDTPHTSSDSTSSEGAPATPPRGATPHEVENIVRRERERLLRVQAH